MNQLNKSLFFILLSFFFSKAIIPDNGSSIILEKDSNEYIYYQFKKDGLRYTDLGNYSKSDSVRIKLFMRAIVPSEVKGKEAFQVKLDLNGKRLKNLSYNKSKSKLDIKGKFGRIPTQSGIWFVDVKLEDFISLTVKGNKNIIVRAQVSKINRDKYSSFKSLSALNKQTKYIIDTKTDKSKSKPKASYWYKLSSKNKELQFEAEGPTSIRIFTRLANPSNNIKENDYSMFVKEDGLDIGTYLFSTESSSISHLRSSKDRVGKWRTCWINVPKGKHYYTVRKGDLSDNSIYLKVKQYDK